VPPRRGPAPSKPCWASTRWPGDSFGGYRVLLLEAVAWWPRRRTHHSPLMAGGGGALAQPAPASCGCGSSSAWWPRWRPSPQLCIPRSLRCDAAPLRVACRDCGATGWTSPSCTRAARSDRARNFKASTRLLSPAPGNCAISSEATGQGSTGLRQCCRSIGRRHIPGLAEHSTPAARPGGSAQLQSPECAARGDAD